MARIPTTEGVASALHRQGEALASLPAALRSLNATVRGLAETAAEFRETVQVIQRVATRLDTLSEELEEPVRALTPGLRRLAVVLDDPVVDDIPDTVRKVREDFLPLVRTVSDTQKTVTSMAGSTERMMGLLDETTRALGLPGAALLGLRWPGGRPGGSPGKPAARPKPPPRAGDAGAAED